MKLIITFLLACLVVLPCGCKSESASPMARQITTHLVQLRDNPTQEQMFEVIGECEKLREAHGVETVAAALKQIAQRKPDLQDQALSLLMRYVSVGEYGKFVKELKTKK
jgi:hypothetical protein